MKISKNGWIVIFCAFLILCLLAGGIAVLHWVKKSEDRVAWSESVEEAYEEYYTSNDEKKIKTLFSHYSKNRNKPLSELTGYSLMLIFEDRKYPETVYASFGCLDLRSFNHDRPIERVEKFNDDYIAVVYRIEDEGTEFYACLGFEYMDVPSFEEKDWLRNGTTYYATPGLSSSDFSSLKVGDSVQKVEEIDPSVVYDFPNLRYSSNADGVQEFYSFRLLKDGIYMITFRENQEVRDESSPWWYAYSVYQTKFYRYGELETINDLIHTSDIYPIIKTFPRYILDE